MYTHTHDINWGARDAWSSAPQLVTGFLVVELRSSLPYFMITHPLSRSRQIAYKNFGCWVTTNKHTHARTCTQHIQTRTCTHSHNTCTHIPQAITWGRTSFVQANSRVWATVCTFLDSVVIPTTFLLLCIYIITTTVHIRKKSTNLPDKQQWSGMHWQWNHV